MFSFLNPLMLFGLIAGAIPLIIHFLTKRKTRKVFFGSLRFLKEIEENKRSRVNIDFFLLLLLRILIILFFCAALARPLARTLTSFGFLGLSKKDAKTVVLLIDDSYSMGYREGGDTLFSKAKKKAKEIIGGISPNDEANIIFFSEKPNNKQTLNNILRNKELSFAKTEVQSALDLAGELFDKSKKPGKALYILSDFQKNGFSDIQPISGVEIVPVVFRPKEVSNLMVAGVEFPDYISVKNITRISARLKSIGKGKKLRAALYLEKNKVGEVNTTLKDDSEGDAVFFYSFPKKGVYNGFVEIEGGDGLKIDDRFYFRVEAMDPLRVLLLTDDKDGDEENFYIEQAFPTVKDSPIVLEIASVNPGVIPAKAGNHELDSRIRGNDGKAGAGMTERFSAIIINNVSKIDEKLQEALLRFANAGGGILISLGNNISIKDYNKNSSLLPALPQFKIGSEEETGKYFKITYFDKSHPVFRIFTAESFASSHFYSFYSTQVNLLDLNTRVLAKFDDGFPFIIEKKIGAGKILLWTSSLDADWNDFPVRPNYLPLLHQAVYYVGAGSLVGAGTPRPLKEGRGPLAPAEESDLSYLSDKEITTRWAAQKEGESPNRPYVKKEISGILLLLVLILLILENILSNLDSRFRGNDRSRHSPLATRHLPLIFVPITAGINVSPQISIFIIFPLAIFAGAVTFYTYRRMDSKGGFGTLPYKLLFLRLAAILVILFILLQPSISIVKEKIEKNNVIFLIDNSGSMGILENGEDRLSRLKELFKEKEFFNNLSKSNNLHFYSFSDKLNKIDSKDILMLKIDDSNTDFFNVLTEINKNFDGQPAAGIFILSDGIDGNRDNTLKLVEGISRPIWTISPGEEKKLVDISIRLQDAQEKVLLDKKAAVNFIIESSNFGIKDVFCILKEDGMEIKKEKFLIKPGKNTLSLEWTPKKAGPHRYSISIPVENREASFRNNEDEFYLDVRKEELYVLVVAGAPSLEYKFLHKYFLKEPNIKTRFLVSKNDGEFFKLEENDGRNCFPDKKEEFFEYDLVIFNDIKKEKIPEFIMSWIKEFVGERGGGVLMTGGENSFQGGGYNGSPLEDILPVVFKKEGPLLNESKFSFELTNEGKGHPVTQLIPDSVKNAQIWKELPVLEGYNIINTCKPGAVALAARSGDKNDIIWAAQSYGRGRTMAIMADDLWRWDFLMTGIGKTSESYERFWSRVVSWLASAKGDIFDVETDKFVYSAGETAHLMVSVLQKDWTARGFIKEKNSKGKDIINFSSNNGNGDLLKAEYKLLSPGEFDITVEVNGGEGFTGRVVKKIFVKKDLTEWQNIKVDEKFLKEISDKSGGKFCSIKELKSLKFNKNLKTRVTYNLTLWDNIFVFCLFVILLASEWYLRKIKGLN